MDYGDIHYYYERVRYDEKQALIERVKKLESMPEYECIAKKKRDIILSLTKNSARNSKQAITKAREELDGLKQSEKELLVRLGLGEDYLSMRYRCELCKDTGYVGDSKRKPCSCFMSMLEKNKKASSQVNNTEVFERFDEGLFKNGVQLRQSRAAAKVAKEFADSFPNSSVRNLMLMGMPGLGKSYLINCIAARVIERGLDAHKVTAYNLMGEILQGIRSGYDAAQQYLDAPLLLIDDLGTEPLLNNLTVDYLFTILNERRNGQKHTVIATNLSALGMHERYGERIFSRLIAGRDSAILELTGENLRFCSRD